MQLKSLLYIASLAPLTLSADINDVLRNLALIQKGALTINTTINAFPRLAGITSFGAALSIHSTTVATVTILDETMADAQTIPTPVSVDDGTKVLNAVIGMTAVVEAALDAVVDKKTSFLGLLGLIPGATALNPVKQDLLNLNTSTVALGNLLVSLAPPELRDQVTAARTAIFGAFAEAIAAYN